MPAAKPFERRDESDVENPGIVRFEPCSKICVAAGFEAADHAGPVEARAAIETCRGIRQVELRFDQAVADFSPRVIGRRREFRGPESELRQ